MAELPRQADAHAASVNVPATREDVRCAPDVSDRCFAQAESVQCVEQFHAVTDSAVLRLGGVFV